MESQRESTDEMEKFAERILAEPEYRRMVLAVLCASGKKMRLLIAGETLLQKLIGPPFQAKTIVTLFRTLQGAEYPGFCRDLFETAKILTEIGAVEEGMTLFIGLMILHAVAPKVPDKDSHGTGDISPAPSPVDPPIMPFSHARSICGSSGERTTFGFEKDNQQIRVTCGMEENEPSLEIAERGPEGTTNCIDLGLDDIPDACGSTVSPPRENLDQWFKGTLEKVAKRISH